MLLVSKCQELGAGSLRLTRQISAFKELLSSGGDPEDSAVDDNILISYLLFLPDSE